MVAYCTFKCLCFNSLIDFSLSKPPEPASETHKRKWVDHKRRVWHESVTEILASIRNAAAFGMPVLCGDGIRRVIYPNILIISADYDEQ